MDVNDLSSLGTTSVNSSHAVGEFFERVGVDPVFLDHSHRALFTYARLIVDLASDLGDVSGSDFRGDGLGVFCGYPMADESSGLENRRPDGDVFRQVLRGNDHGHFGLAGLKQKIYELRCLAQGRELVVDDDYRNQRFARPLDPQSSVAQLLEVLGDDTAE